MKKQLWISNNAICIHNLFNPLFYMCAKRTHWLLLNATWRPLAEGELHELNRQMKNIRSFAYKIMQHRNTFSRWALGDAVRLRRATQLRIIEISRWRAARITPIIPLVKFQSATENGKEWPERPACSYIHAWPSGKMTVHKRKNTHINRHKNHSFISKWYGERSANAKNATGIRYFSIFFAPTLDSFLWSSLERIYYFI